MASVSHSGRTVITEAEGGWNYTPSVTGQDIEVIKLAKAVKLKVKDLGKSGGSISLNIDFAGTASQFDSFKNRIADLYDMTVGNLRIPTTSGIDDVYEDTVFIGSPQFNEVIPLADGEALYNVTLDLLMQ